MTKFNVGDSVRISAAGRKSYEDTLANPHHLVGRITGIQRPLDKPQWYTVAWGSGKVNVYLENQLESAHPVPRDNPAPTLEQLRGTVVKLSRKATKAAELYNAELARRQAALGTKIKYQLSEDIAESEA